ncbi:MAG: hypothetical protein R3B48_24595 [Kofleriaceae bacterium]
MSKILPFQPPDPALRDATESLPGPLRDVVELFRGQLVAVSFPDVDAEVLLRGAEEVAARRRAVDEAREQLDHATTALAAELQQLTTLAERGLAYARIYAAAHPEHAALTAGLAQLEVDSAALGAGAVPRRGRRRAARPELPFAASSDAVEDEALLADRVAPAPADEAPAEPVEAVASAVSSVAPAPADEALPIAPVASPASPRARRHAR